MANLALTRGAEPKGEPKRINSYTAGGTIYPGDLVKFNNAGQVVVAAASDALLGAAVSKATSGNEVLVADHPDQMFIIASDDATEPAALTALNLNYDFVATAGSSSYNLSRNVLDGSTGATTATLPLKLVALDSRPNNTFGAKADCVVVINNHLLKGGTGTAGI